MTSIQIIDPAVIDKSISDPMFPYLISFPRTGSHWLRIEAPLLQASGVVIGDTIAFQLAPVAVEPEPRVPSDLQQALADHPSAHTTWDDITPLARRDWIQWMTSGKKAETRTKRIATACDMLASGKRRACCFDRSGMYSRGNMGAPEAAD